MSQQKGDLQSRLRRLGVVKGARKLKPAPPSKQRPISKSSYDPPEFSITAGDALDSLLPGGRVEETAVGACYVFDHVYPLSYQHGDDRLAELLDFLPKTAVPYEKDPRFENLDFQDFLFLDTETTGLAGAGTLAFMVGVAFFEKRRADVEGQVFVVRQYFLRDHGDEAAMLTLLEELLADKTALVTFNGRSFDVPLLDGRYLMNRMITPFADVPHLDLLSPSRRLWRNRLGSCALSALEPNLMGVHRTHEDVPGFLIPSLYHNYLRTGNPQELVRVFYHNRIDMLSMVTLATRVMRQLGQPNGNDDALDLFSLGKWQADLGMVPDGEQNLRLAVTGDLSLEDYHKALYRLGLLLKQNGRRAEAVPLWKQIASTTFDDTDAHIELAKFYEWHEKSLPQAIYWTEQAISLVDGWGRRGEMALAELNHRLERLKRKMGDE